MNLKELVIKKYKFGFEAWGSVLFLIVMIPNLIWFAVPAPNDILRAPSITPTIDTIGSVFQVLFVGSLCFIVSRDRKPLRFSVLIISVLVCVLIYLLGWILYYKGFTQPPVFLILTIFPCLAFVFFCCRSKKHFRSNFCVGFFGVPCDFWNSKFHNIVT